MLGTSQPIRDTHSSAVKRLAFIVGATALASIGFAELVNVASRSSGLSALAFKNQGVDTATTATTRPATLQNPQAILSK